MFRECVSCCPLFLGFFVVNVTWIIREILEYILLLEIAEMFKSLQLTVQPGDNELWPRLKWPWEDTCPSLVILPVVALLKFSDPLSVFRIPGTDAVGARCTHCSLHSMAWQVTLGKWASCVLWSTPPWPTLALTLPAPGSPTKPLWPWDHLVGRACACRLCVLVSLTALGPDDKPLMGSFERQEAEEGEK